MRLQWWREAIAGIHAGKPPEHPVAIALSAAVRGTGARTKRHGLTLVHFSDQPEHFLWIFITKTHPTRPSKRANVKLEIGLV